MKELSIEEKAKRYDEVIAMAKECITYIPDEAVNKYMLNMFPELQESGDEKIRKELIEHIKANKEVDFVLFKKFSPDEVLAWLEKQGNKPRCKSALEATTEEKVENVDKVVPKFDVDDWIVCNETLVKIVDCDNNRYTVETTEGLRWSALIGTVDREFHKWTIKDAKAGDALTTVGNEYSFIYKGCLDPKHPNSPVAYCGLDLKGELCVNSRKSNHWWTDTTVHPATKAQRDLLFSKMHEAGYVWDETRLKLKKIKSDNEL